MASAPEVAAAPTGGFGLALDLNGQLPLSVRQTLPGYLLNHTLFTSTVNCSAGTELSPVAVVTATDPVSGGAVLYDGTPIRVEFNAAYASCAGGSLLALSLWDGTDLGRLRLNLADGENPYAVAYLTPTPGLHSYAVYGWRSAGAGIVGPAVGAGGVGTALPGFIRITKA